MKKSIGINTYLFPLPTVVVGTYDEKNNPNGMVASWTGVVNSQPPMISVSLRKATYSYKNILQKKAFTVSIPSKKHILQMDYIGTKSGRNEDKFAKTGLTSKKSELVDAPFVEEFPVVIECELVKSDDLGLHTMFVGEIKDIKIDSEFLNERDMPDIKKIDPIAYMHGEREYYEIGKYLGKANRMWQNTSLNDKFTKSYEIEIIDFIDEYYRKLDDAEDMDKFMKFFRWEDFEINNKGQQIASLEDYKMWYEEVKRNMFNKKHFIEKIQIEEIEKNKLYEIYMDMLFQCDTWQYGDARSRAVKVNGKIELQLTKVNGQYKITKYNIL